MITIKKQKNRIFRILNLTDPQLRDSDWSADESALNKEGVSPKKLLVRTVNELVRRTEPDLITITGDLSFAGQFDAYMRLADYMDSFDIPWTNIWGNHDNQDGAEAVDRVVAAYLKKKNYLYEKGDPSLGNGNFIIGIKENGRLISGLIMMDSHDRMPYVAADGKTGDDWARFYPEQLIWYREQIKMLEALGCHDTMIFTHIPLYAYRTAYKAALRLDVDSMKIPADHNSDDIWNDGYKDSFGINHEKISSYPADDGLFAMLKEYGSTKHFICGHDHVNNSVITYEGVKLIYGMKTGIGSYHDIKINGGTVISIDENGVFDVRHEFVDAYEVIKDS